MTFTPGVPFDGQTLGNSKPQVRNNFTNLFNTFAIDHVNGNDSTNPGRHNFSSYLAQGADPATPVNICALYSKVVGPAPQIFFRQQSSGAVYQLTGTSAAATSVPSIGANGFSFLPGGAMIQWWSATASGATLNFPTAFPNNCFSLTATVHSATSGIAVVTAIVNAAQYQAKSNPSGQLCYFIAIGN